MKKQKLKLGKKLFLNKEAIISLNQKEMTAILGGDQYTAVVHCGPATQKTCPQTVPQQCLTAVPDTVCTQN